MSMLNVTTNLPRAALVIVVFCSALFASCSTDPEPASVASSTTTPADLVDRWLSALDGTDIEELVATTDARRVALMTGAENDLSNNQLYAIVDSGLPGTTLQSYWASFRESFLTFLGTDISAIEVGTVEEYSVGEMRFAAVEIGQEGASAEVITIFVDDEWRIDLVATAGAALSAQLTDLVARLIDSATEEDAVAANNYRTSAITSLRAALERDPGNRALQLDVDAIESVPRA